MSEQNTRVREAMKAWEYESRVLRALLIMHDARFGDPASGVEFNPVTLEITDGGAT